MTKLAFHSTLSAWLESPPLNVVQRHYSGLYPLYLAHNSLTLLPCQYNAGYSM